jgi:hypothetical protein
MALHATVRQVILVTTAIQVTDVLCSVALFRLTYNQVTKLQSCRGSLAVAQIKGLLIVSVIMALGLEAYLCP